MPLTHVKLFKDGEWVDYSIEEARRNHPYGRISFRSGLLICDLCNQPVMMTQANIRDSYFKHSSIEADKNCPERTFGSDYLRQYYTTIRPEKRGLPIRIKLSESGDYHFEMGFPFVDELHIKKVNIQIIGGWKTFNFSSERLNPMTVTYLNIGDEIYQKYKILVTAQNKRLPISWPTEVECFDNRGLFQKSNGLYIPKGSDIHVGYEYIAVLRFGWLRSYDSHVEVKQFNNVKGYKIYSVIPKDLDVETARFFLQEFQCRLAEAPAQVIEIWPEVIHAPFLMYHRKETLYTFMYGDVFPQLFPAGSTGISTQKTVDGSLLRIRCFERQQLMAVGRAAKILDYTYYWQSDLDTVKQYKRAQFPLRTTDSDSSEYIMDGVLAFTPAYDGKIVVEKKGWVVNQYTLKSGEYFYLEKVDQKAIYKVFQGLDCIWQSKISNETHECTTGTSLDTQLLMRLKKSKGETVKLPYFIKSLGSKMKQYPLSKLWVAQRINQGEISREAIKVLTSEFRK